MMGMLGLPFLPKPETLFSLDPQETRRWWKRFGKLTHKKKVKAMQKIHSDHGVELSRPREIFGDMSRRLDKVGIFSLSEYCNNELMWSHYGGSHTGLSIGFKRSTNCKLGDHRHTMPVDYCSDKPTFTTGLKQEAAISMTPSGSISSKSRVSFEDEVFRAALSTKTPAWKYEQEWRYVEESNGLFDLPGELVSVTFGLRMKPERRAFYHNLAIDSVGENIDFYEVVQNELSNGFAVKQAS